MKRNIAIAVAFAAALSFVSANPANAQVVHGSNPHHSIPAWGYCLFGSAWGPIYATLRLNKQLKQDQAYTSMSWCGLGSLYLVYNEKNKR